MRGAASKVVVVVVAESSGECWALRASSRFKTSFFGPYSSSVLISTVALCSSALVEAFHSGLDGCLLLVSSGHVILPSPTGFVPHGSLRLCCDCAISAHVQGCAAQLSSETYLNLEC